MASIDIREEKQTLHIVLSGDFLRVDKTSALYEAASKSEIKQIHLSCRDTVHWDSSLLLILFELTNIAVRRKISFQTDGLPSGLEKMYRLAIAVPSQPLAKEYPEEDFLTAFGSKILTLTQAVKRGTAFALESCGALWRFMTASTVTRAKDVLFALQECGPGAVGIVSLISFMVGLILAFVGAIQLRSFGAQIYVASLVTIGMIRIMGAVMSGIIMAGRTGASFAATLGTMQVNEEIDALRTMGIPISEFLVVPRLFALVLVMPILTMWADFMGMFGGGFVGVMLLNIPASEYWKYSLLAWSPVNFWVGMFHGFIFGFIIALCGCYYGIHSGRNADGVGTATTKAVVSAIVWMIVATGLITLVFERIGL